MQIHRLCKLCSFYEKLPEDFLDETDVDSYFYHYNFDNSQSHHRIACDSKGSNKKVFCYEFVPILRFEDKTALYPPRRFEHFQKRTRLFLRTFGKASKCLHIPLPNPKTEIGSTKSKDNLFTHHYEDIIELSNKQVC